MNKGKSIAELGTELTRIQNAKLDFVAVSAAMRTESNGHTNLYLGNQSFEMLNPAHGQLAEFLGVPKAFYDKLRSDTAGLRVDARDDINFEVEGDSLFDVTVNTLLQANEGRRLVRTLDGKARAFLSDTYSTDMDNFDVFNAFAQCLIQTRLGVENILSTEVTDSKLYLKVVNPRLQADVKVGDTVQAGFILTNSEVGAGSLSVRQFIYRLTCLNGAVTEVPLRQRHVGKRLEADDSGIVFKDDTRLADARARLLMMRDHMVEAISEHKFYATVEAMQAATGVPISKRVPDVIQLVTKKYGFTPFDAANIERHLIEGADMSLYGLSNAVTRAAQDVKDYDRSTDMEIAGGGMYYLPKGEIKELVA